MKSLLLAQRYPVDQNLINNFIPLASLYAMKTSENQLFSGISRGHRKRPSACHGSKVNHKQLLLIIVGICPVDNKNTYFTFTISVRFAAFITKLPLRRRA